MIKIGPHEIDVQYVHELPDSDFGLYQNRQARILIDNTVHPSLQEETLVHEVLHAIINISGVGVGWEHDEEERIVQGMGALLYQVLKDNDKFYEQQ